MNKSKIYLYLGVFCVQVGACIIHFGFGLIIFGLWLLLGSYIEFEEENEKLED